MKIMTFNLRTNVASDGFNAWPNRYTVAAGTIREHDADIVCVQEALHGMLQDLEGQLPDYAWVGEGRRGGLEDEFCAIFYKKEKLDLQDYGNFGLSENPERPGQQDWETACPRMCTWARFKSVQGEKFAVFNTHLDHISEEAQTKGMELIRKRIGLVREQTGMPAVLTGDFNVGPGHAVVKGLEEAGFLDAYSGLPGGAAAAGATFHDFKGGEEGEPIDYIFATPGIAFERLEVDRREYEDRYPSDHYPIIAVLKLDR